MNDSIDRPNPILELFRSKMFWQQDHCTKETVTTSYGTVVRSSTGLHHAISCCILAHDVVATAWLEIHECSSNTYVLRLYAIRWAGELLQKPCLVFEETISTVSNDPEQAITSLCKRFDRIVVTKERIFLRDHDLIDDLRNVASQQYWKQFLWPPHNAEQPKMLLHVA